MFHTLLTEGKIDLFEIPDVLAGCYRWDMGPAVTPFDGMMTLLHDGMETNKTFIKISSHILFANII